MPYILFARNYTEIKGNVANLYAFIKGNKQLNRPGKGSALWERFSMPKGQLGSVGTFIVEEHRNVLRQDSNFLLPLYMLAHKHG